MTDKNKTLIFIDWDDTFFPTSWVFDQGIEIMDPNIREKYSKIFRELDLLIYNFLNKIEKYGKVIIITNAMPEWVQLSCSLLTDTNKAMKNIPILSAKKLYKEKTSNQKIWKTMCFNDILKSHTQKIKITNIISIGDAFYEYDALVNLYRVQKNHHERFLKAIQLTRYPSYKKLYEQLHIMYNCIEHVCLHKNHLDIHFDHHNES